LCHRSPSGIKEREERERELSDESEDAFVWMGVSGRRKHTIRVLTADWSNDRRCGSRPSEVQLYVIFGVYCPKQPASNVFGVGCLRQPTQKIITYFYASWNY
jgi:hypothetical protein